MTISYRVFWAALALLVVSAPASAARERAFYIGTDRNWFEPGNWSTGQVPGPQTDVVLDGDDDVLIDGGAAPATVRIADLYLLDRAKLETTPGTTLWDADEYVLDAAQFITRATRGGSLGTAVWGVTGGYNSGGILLNPRPQSKRDLVLKGNLTMGLGGTRPATQNAVGAGRYATINAQWARLGGQLDVALFYGFTPRVGQVFTIIRSRDLTQGQFDGLPEGAVAATFGGVALTISYRGGDGDDVALTAVAASP